MRLFVIGERGHWVLEFFELFHLRFTLLAQEYEPELMFLVSQVSTFLPILHTW